jgi:predicted RNA-binding protein Jag
MEPTVTEPTTDREDLAEKASEFLLGVLERMGISADIDIKDDVDKTVLEMVGDARVEARPGTCVR